MKQKFFFIVFGLFIFSIVISCKDTLPLPNALKPGNSTPINSNQILPPTNVTASHGQKKQIHISWKEVSKAASYYIFKADSPHDEYIQIDEIKAPANSITIPTTAGYSGYFKVASVLSNGKTSDKSLTTYGTSLAAPTITSIAKHENNVTVYWYMENLNKNTYLNSIQFLVSCYNTDGSLKEQKLIKETTDTFCTFENLHSGTMYTYDVEAYLLGNQTNSEKSLKIDAETAISLIPSIPYFTTTEGTKENDIDIEITLPPEAKAITQVGNGGSDVSTYENKPLFFRIERLNPSTNAYEIIEDYFAFNGSTSLIPKDSEEFKNYKEGNKIIFTDSKSIKRGTQYHYRVRSFIDNNYDNNNNQLFVTHDASKAYVKIAWAAAIPFLSTSEIRYGYSESNPEQIITASINLEANWNSNGKDEEYSFVILQNHKKLKSNNNGVKDEVGTDSIIQNDSSYYFSSIDEINAFTINYDLQTTQNQQALTGYYSYSIYIVPNHLKDENPNPSSNLQNIKDNCLTFAIDPNSKLITTHTDNIYPKNFNIEDGYKDKIKVSFTPEANTTYKLIKKRLTNEGLIDTNFEPETIPFDESTSGSYEDSNVDPGRGYQYTLYASNIDFENIPSESLTGFTLTQAEVFFNPESTDYSTISVNWKGALHSEDLRLNGISSKNIKYIVNYNNQSLIFNHADFHSETEETISRTESQGELDYTISCTKGEDFNLLITKGIHNFDYSGEKPKISFDKAGENATLELRIENDITLSNPNNYTSDSIQVRTLGSNQTGITTSQGTYKNYIYVSWKAIPGITTYAIKRTCPKILVSDAQEKVDIIYINSSNDVLVNGDKVSSDRIEVSYDGTTYTLKDNHCTASDITSSFQQNQEKIAYGLEYKYVVTPVKSIMDNPFDSSFNIEYTSSDSSSICKIGFTTGYGININASKSEYNDAIEVTWQKPNRIENKMPYIWYKEKNDSTWYNTIGNNTTDTKYTFIIDSNTRCKEIEFFVTYDFKNTLEIEESYSKYLTTSRDSDGEQNNVGYSFSINNFTAIHPTQTNETFSEVLNWSLWDESDPRKKKPGDNMTSDCYEIQVLNLNCSNKWNTIATISKTGNITITNQNWYDVSIEKIGSTGLKITALNNGQNFTTSQRLKRDNTKASVIKGTHNGLLKVQRDYKHYYRLVAKRINNMGDEISTYLGNFYDPIGNSTICRDQTSKTPIYSYRKITDDEFIKAVFLIVADATYQAGVTDSGSLLSSTPPDKAYIDGAEGRFCAWHQGTTKNYFYGTNEQSYKHLFRGGTPGNTDSQLTSGWTINMPITKTSSASDGIKVFHFGWGTIKVTHETNLPSYTGHLIMRAGNDEPKNEKFRLAIQYSRTSNAPDTSDKICVTDAYPNDTSYNDSYDNYYAVLDNEQIFKTWFPFQLGASIDPCHEYNSNLPIYQGTWWEVKN